MWRRWHTAACSRISHEVPYIDLSKDYWDQKANEDLTIGGRMFYTTGDISAWSDNMQSRTSLLFNKDMIESYGLDNPYDLVAERRTGTFDDLRRAGASRSDEDLDNNGVYDENDLLRAAHLERPDEPPILAAAGEKHRHHQRPTASIDAHAVQRACGQPVRHLPEGIVL